LRELSSLKLTDIEITIASFVLMGPNDEFMGIEDEGELITIDLLAFRFLSLHFYSISLLKTPQGSIAV
jgi:hypothetical protein